MVRQIVHLSKKHQALLVFVFSLIFLLLNTAHGRGFIFDDPGIFWRYARHLGTGGGWSFNSSGTGNAITSPLYLIILGAFSFTFGYSCLPTVTTLMFCVLLSGVSAVTFSLFKKENHIRAGFIFAALVCSCPLLIVTIGMESSLYLFLFISASYLFNSKKYFLSGTLAGLAVLTRPDALILLIVFLAWNKYKKQSGNANIILSFSLVIIPWLLFSFINFSTIYPSTLNAKIAQGHSGLWAPFIEGILLVPFTYGIVYSLMLVIPFFLGTRFLFKYPSQIFIIILLTTVVFTICYSILWVPWSYEWYFALPIFSALIISSFGIEHLFQIFHGWKKSILAILVALTVVMGIVEIPSSLPTPRVDYEAVGKWLNTNSSPRASVAATEIGLIGYYSDRTIVDYLGLLDPSYVQFIKRGNVSAWMHKAKPDYIVVLKAREFITLEDFIYTKYFTTWYKPVKVIGDCTIFRRLQSVNN